MIYFDNAATGGFKPPCVIAAVTDALKKYSVNAGRSSHKTCIEALRIVTLAREQIASLFGVKYIENVIFTKNCTEALNIAILGTVKQGGEIIITANEHNSVIRPCHELKRAGRVNIKVACPDENGAVTADIIEECITEKTYLVCVNHVSNVTGGTSDIESIARLCAKNNIIFLCDAAQSAGHTDIDMNLCGINILTVAAHKGLLAPQGLGVMCFNGVKINPVMYGGTGTESNNIYQPTDAPEAFECGTLNLPAIAGLSAALKHLASNKNEFEKNMQANFEQLYGALCENPMINVYSHKNKCGIISFLVNGCNAETTADILNEKYDIAVRAGLCCAPLINKHIGTLKSGIVRASLSPFNTAAEIKCFLNAIDNITYN